MPRAGVGGETGFARDLDILEAISEAIGRTHDGLRLTEIAVATGRAKSQVSRALGRLEAAGLVARADDSRVFVLGWRLFRFAAMTAEARLIRSARPVMLELVAAIGETAHLCVLRGTASVTLHSEIPHHGFRGLAWVGVQAPAHTLTAGRVLLAECGPDELARLYPDETLPDVPPTGHVRTRTELTAECARIRDQGYAIVDEEFELGLVGASAVVYDFRGIAIASLNVAAPKSRLVGRLDALGQHLARVARRLSVSLGQQVPGGSPATR